MKNSQILRYALLAALTFTAITIAFVAWGIFFLPTSINEALFRYRLSSAIQQQKNQINFVELTPFDWEEVCDHHPYNGEFKHPNYNRTYRAPMSAARDEAWVLLFIDKGGSPTYISGSCSHGSAFIREFGCRSRKNATFYADHSSTCPSYSAIDNM